MFDMWLYMFNSIELTWRKIIVFLLSYQKPTSRILHSGLSVPRRYPFKPIDRSLSPRYGRNSWLSTSCERLSTDCIGEFLYSSKLSPQCPCPGQKWPRPSPAPQACEPRLGLSRFSVSVHRRREILWTQLVSANCYDACSILSEGLFQRYLLPRSHGHRTSWQLLQCRWRSIRSCIWCSPQQIGWRGLALGRRLPSWVFALFWGRRWCWPCLGGFSPALGCKCWRGGLRRWSCRCLIVQRWPLFLQAWLRTRVPRRGNFCCWGIGNRYFWTPAFRMWASVQQRWPHLFLHGGWHN